MIRCYIDEQTNATLEDAAQFTGRTVQELAEDAIAEAALRYRVAKPTGVARDGIEAQRGLNDTWPGDPYP